MPKKSFNSLMQNMKEELIKIRKQYKEQTNSLIDDSWRIFEEGSQLLFKKYKNLDSFSWVQFNSIVIIKETERNVFAAYVDEPKINDIDLYDVYEKDKKLSEAADNIIDFLTLFHDEVLQKMFGDQVLVKVTREGALIEAHDNDVTEEEHEEDED